MTTSPKDLLAAAEKNFRELVELAKKREVEASEKGKENRPARSPLKRLSNHSSHPTPEPPLKRVKPSSRPPPTPKCAEALLETVNSYSILDFSGRYFPQSWAVYTTKNNQEYTIMPHTNETLSEDERIRCFNLVEETSSAHYKASSNGWDPEFKKEEMAEEDMFYLLVRRSRTQLLENWDGVEKIEDHVCAFLSYMLTMEAHEPVIYIYEVHLDQGVRGIGLGKHLMKFAETTGRNVGVTKSMLTVFTRNEFSEAFYRKLGYTEDEISPQARKLRGLKVKKPEYLIMSKVLNERETQDGRE